MPDQIRLNSYIARCGVCSRRQADELISNNRVKVNSVVTAVLGTKIEIGKDEVEVEGKAIALPEKKAYYALNKPAGVVTTLDDPQKRKNVGEYVAEIGVHLYPIGRLDRNSDGLLLLTNDGELSHKIQHPRHEVPKEYIVLLHKPLDANDLAKIRKGVTLEDGFLKVKSIEATKKPLPHREFKLTIAEGRNRILRRLFEEFGYKVVKLTRISVGGVKLGSMTVGSWRLLTADEIQALKKLTNLG